MDVTGKTAIVTGSAVGVGRAVALDLAKRGANVVINYSRSEDDAYARGDVRDAYLGLSLRPDRWLSLSAEVMWDVSGEDFDRGPGGSARMALPKQATMYR